MPENDSRKIVDKVKSDYNLIAKEWDLSRNQPSRIKLNLINDVEADTEVLDIGCGNGLIFPYIKEKDAFYFGLDIAENLIEIAQERYAREIENGKAKFLVGEATDLPFKDGEFDFVISFAVLHHLPSEELRKKFFGEIFRVLRPNGKVKITVWNLFNDWAKSRFDIGLQLEGKNSGDVTIPWKGTQGVIVNRYVHQFSKEELYSLAKPAGFSDVRVDYFNRAGERVENGEEMVVEIGMTHN
jgi:tRNA (uracil-5-)-methyltransferase TRM9